MEGVYVGLAVVGVLALVFAVWLGGTYNGLVRVRQHLRDSWAGIETELQRRYDLIPNLVETVKGYAKHEREVLERVVELRNKAACSTGAVGEQAADENRMIGGLKQLFAVVEAYPDLKADGNFLHLQGELVNTEDRIAAARRFYNGNVRDLNTRVETVPSNLVAGMFGFKREEYFEIEDASVRGAVRVEM